jgi:hypothetical protein
LRFVTLLRAVGGIILVLAALVALTGGFQFSVGALRISATSASRLFFEGATVLLLSMCGAGLYGPRRGPLGSAPLLTGIALFLIAAAADSDIRRVGDGFEYLAMARHLSRGAPASVSESEGTALAAEMARHGDPTWDVQLMPSLRGADGRYDFPHFWMCSLAAAPFVAVVSAFGAHPALGFTLMNLALVLGVCWLLIRSGAPLIAVLFTALVLWWIDKAHAEIFFAALTAGALLLRAYSPTAAVVLLGLAAAQGPVLAVLLVACIVEALVRPGRTRRIVVAAAAALLVAGLHPLYYVWRLGAVSPLPDTVVPHVPAFRAVVTPLVDLNLGVFWFAPLLCAITVAGAVAAIRQRATAMVVPVIGAAALLAAASIVTNVNHGGTPGMSRYGLWVLSLLVPLASHARVTARWGRLLTAGTAFTVVFAALVLHPERPDAGVTPRPTALAGMVWTYVPGLDNPLPEVFVERVRHADGIAATPTAFAGCAKSLLVGGIPPDGCPADDIPRICTAPGALCYSNGGVAEQAPLQPGFTANTLSTR